MWISTPIILLSLNPLAKGSVLIYKISRSLHEEKTHINNVLLMAVEISNLIYSLLGKVWVFPPDSQQRYLNTEHSPIDRKG